MYVSVVTRIEARSEKCGMFVQLDVNTEIYPIDKEERFLMALSTTLSLEVILFYLSLNPFSLAANDDHNRNQKSEKNPYICCNFLKFYLCCLFKP